MEYPQFNVKDLDGYVGNNPFILEIEKRYRSGNFEGLSSFENEYLLKNYKYKPYELTPLTLEISGVTAERLKKDFNLNREVSSATFNRIIGETDEWYHVSNKNGTKEIFFWLNRNEVGDLYEADYDRIEVDFTELNKMFSKGSLFSHQEKAVKFLQYHEKCFLMDTVGAGKTYSSIASSIVVQAKKVLIICIAGKQLDWKKELAHWGKTSRIIWGENGWIEGDYTYTIIGCDVLPAYHEEGKNGKKVTTLYRPLYDEGFDCIIIDEVQKFREPKAKKSKVLSDLTLHPNAKYIWAMTATAIEKNDHIYDLCRNMNISVTDIIYTKKDYGYLDVVSKYDDFVKRYCGAFRQNGRAGMKSFMKKTGNTNTFELAQRIKHIQRRRRTEVVTAGFPNKIISELYFELSTIQKREAGELFDKYVIKKGNKSLEEVRNLTEMILLRQYYAIQKVESTVASVLSAIEDGKRCIVFTNFKEEYEKFKKRLKKYAVCVDSGMDGQKRQAKIDEFMNDDKKMVLVGNIDSIGTGLNITKADQIYFNSPSWSSDKHEQAEGRAWRIGRIGDVEVFYCLFDETIELDVYEAARGKQLNRSIFYGEQHLSDEKED